MLSHLAVLVTRLVLYEDNLSLSLEWSFEDMYYCILFQIIQLWFQKALHAVLEPEFD